MLRNSILQFACCLVICHYAGSSEAAEFALQDADRVVLLGDGLIEQEQYAGWLELMLTTSFPDDDISFRNLGWNGDTPAGVSRQGLSLLQAGHEPPDEGWRQLQTQLELTRPTVLIVGYGMASSLEGGEAGLTQFVADYQRLLDAVRRISPEVRLLLLSPLSPLPSAETNSQLKRAQTAEAQTAEARTALYVSSIREIAERNQASFVDISRVGQSPAARKDSIHLNDAGYRELAIAISKSLKFADVGWTTSPYSEALRQVIVKKNEWWFHRSRPANMAYVFGFRKHEQGQNAVEIPKFDELIVAEEQHIGDLRRLQPSQLENRPLRVESEYAKFTAQATPEFTVADGWEVNLWAENPQLNKPIQINFDPQGRLWVASSEAYPMIEVGQSPPDKILVLEDTNGDGTADKSTVFADGLLIPTGVVPGDGGVYVAQSTDLLFLQDTDGDGRADRKRRVLSGFGTEDTHHNLHTLTWGPDGRLYMNQSVYTRTDAETPHGVVRLKAGGGFRLDTQTLRLEVVFRGLWNAWGHQFDERGQSFLTDGAGFDGVAYSFPSARFNPTPSARRQLALIGAGKYPKFASMEIVYGDSFPADWQGSIVTCDFRANRVTRFSLRDQGSGFATEPQADLLRTSAASFRPIDVKQGPDGALYIADWSNPIINHGEVDFRDPRRDRWHGRIWRVAWTGGKPHPKVDLTKLTTEQLLNLLSSNDRYSRDQARRVLTEHAEATQALLPSWSNELTDDASRLQALWLQQSFNQFDMPLLKGLLNSSDGNIRAAAVRVLSSWSDPKAIEFAPLPSDLSLRLLRERVADEHPRVRLEAIHGLARLGSAEAGLTALDALQSPTDRFILYALEQTIDDLAEPLMAVIDSGAWQADTQQRERQLEFVLTSIPPERARNFLANYLNRSVIPADGAGPWIELIGKAGGLAEVNLLFQRIADKQNANGKLSSSATVRGLNALREAFQQRKLRPANAQQTLLGLLSTSDSEVQLATIELAGVWKLNETTDQLVELAKQENGGNELRAAAIGALGSIASPAAQDGLLALVAPGLTTDGTRRAQALGILASIAPSKVAGPFYEFLSTVSDEERALQLWRSMLANPAVGKILAAALPSSGISQTAARAGVRATRDGGREEPELLAALLPLSGLGELADQMKPAQIASLARMAAANGDASRGESLYRKSELACATCHAIGGVGGRVGPDLTSIGASAPIDYIVESLFNPNAKIKEGFHSVTVATEDGLVINGIEVSGGPTELVIRDLSNKLVTIPTSEVTAKKPGPSLMPVGVVERLSESEQLDLIRFLSLLGKPGPFDASQVGVARRLEILAGTHRLEQSGADPIIQGKIDGWKPLTSLASGQYTTAMLTDLTAQPMNIALIHVYARTTFQAAMDGRTAITVAAGTPMAMWIDGQSVPPATGDAATGDAATKYEVDLSAGPHNLLLRLDARELPASFKLFSSSVTFATE